MKDYAFVEYKNGSYWVKCPFHSNGNERTPSMKLNVDRGSYYCFSCHETGDIFTLLQKKEGLDFSQSVSELARRVGLDVSYDSSPESKKRKSDKEKLYEVYDEVRRIYYDTLLKSPSAEKAREYLKERGVNLESIQKFSLGYATPDNHSLFRDLSKKYDAAFLKESGLFSKNFDGLSLFVDRLMFPIRDRMGKTVAFSGRDLSNRENAPKYINSPETMIYHKKEMLFGQYEAKDALLKGMTPIICEGNFDVVSLHQGGFISALAPLGTSYTEEQAKSLRRWLNKNDNVDLLFDSDEAGQNETKKAIVLSLKAGLIPEVLTLKSGKDPSEVLQKGGSELLNEELKTKESAFDYLLRTLMDKYDATTAKGKINIIQEMAEYIFSLDNQIEIDDVILRLSNRLNINESSLRSDLNKYRQKQNFGYSKTADQSTTHKEVKNENENIFGPEHFALYYLCSHRNLFKDIKNKISYPDFQNSESSVIFSALENAFRYGYETDELFLSLIDDDDIRNNVSVSFALDEYKEEDGEAFDEAITRIIVASLDKEARRVNEQIELASNENDKESLEVLLETKQKLDKELKAYRKSLIRK